MTIGCFIFPARERLAAEGGRVGPAGRHGFARTAAGRWGCASTDALGRARLMARRSPPSALPRFRSASPNSCAHKCAERNFWPTTLVGRQDDAKDAQRPRIKVRAEAAGQLGPFIPNPTIPMALNCYPVLYDSDLPFGRTHKEHALCPFKSDQFPQGKLSTCCSLRGEDAVDELDALGALVYDRMFKFMTAGQALRFADKLEETADDLERKYAGRRKPHGAGHDGRWDAARKRWVWKRYSTFAQALATIRWTVFWYRKVASFGFDVEPKF